MLDDFINLNQFDCSCLLRHRHCIFSQLGYLSHLRELLVVSSLYLMMQRHSSMSVIIKWVVESCMGLNNQGLHCLQSILMLIAILGHESRLLIRLVLLLISNLLLLVAVDWRLHLLIRFMVLIPFFIHLNVIAYMLIAILSILLRVHLVLLCLAIATLSTLWLCYMSSDWFCCERILPDLILCCFSFGCHHSFHLIIDILIVAATFRLLSLWYLLTHAFVVAQWATWWCWNHLHICRCMFSIWSFFC